MNTCEWNEISGRPKSDSGLICSTPIKPMTLESRNKPRYRCNLSLALEGSGITGWSCLQARSIDLSESGIAAIVECGLFPGDNAQIKLELPHSGEVLLLPAVIQNRSNSRYGFHFLSLSPRQISSLSDFCRMLEPLPADPQDRVSNMRESIQQTESRTRLIQDQRRHIEVLKDMLKFTDGAARRHWTAEIEKLEAELKLL